MSVCVCLPCTLPPPACHQHTVLSLTHALTQDTNFAVRVGHIGNFDIIDDKWLHDSLPANGAAAAAASTSTFTLVMPH